MSKNPVMTTKELAEYIKMNEKTVLKMAQNGQIPGVKIGNQWRFHLTSIDGYLQRDIMESSDEELDSLIKTAENITPLSRLTGSNYIKLNSKARGVDDVLAELAKVAYEGGVAVSEEGLFKELKKREKMLSTAIGNGVAIPHPRHPSYKLFKGPKIIIMRSKEGVEYAAPDRKPIRIFFMVCAPSEFIHLRLLAKIAKLLKFPDAVRRIISSPSKEQIMQVFMEFDRERMFSAKK